MSILKTLFNPDLKEQFEIKDIRASEFAERLQTRVDEKPKDFLSRTKSEFYGKVGKDSFRLSLNKLAKLEGSTFYGKFYSFSGRLILEIRFSPSANQKGAPIIVIVLGVVATALVVVSETLSWGYSLLILPVAFGIAAISSHSVRMKEMEGLLKLLRRIFSDKEISLTKSTLRR